MRIKWRTLRLAGVLVAAGLTMSNGALATDQTPVVHVKTVVKDGGVSLEAEANGPFEYTTYRPSANLFVLDLSGVSDGDPSGARVITSDVVKGYRVQSYSLGNKPVVRVEILLDHAGEPRIERQDSENLVLTVGPSTAPASSGPTISAAPVTREAAPSAAAVRVTPAAPVAVTPQAAVVPAAADSSTTNSVEESVAAIRNVNLKQNGTATEVNVVGSGPLKYEVARLQNPDRLVLDFADSYLKTPGKHIASDLDPVRAIRMAQFAPKVSRVVIDLREPAQYNVSASGSTVTVSFAASASSGAVKGAPGATPADVVTTKTAAPKRLKDKQPIAKAGVIPIPATTLPAALTTSGGLAAPVASIAGVQPVSYAPVNDSPAPVAASAAAQPVAVAIHSASGETETTNPATALRTGTSTDPAFAPNQPLERRAPIDTTAAAPAAMPSQAPTPATSNKYSGEPISVNLKDVDLQDFFRLIHEISGLNVVVDPSVKGTLTIVLDDVPWDQALDIVLHNNDLDKQLDGNVLRIATKDTLRKEAEESRDLAKAQAEAEDVVTTTRVLSYAKATTMATTIKKFLSSRGDILADDRSNTLIIRDIPSTMPIVDNLLRQLDRKSQQVEIEARIVSATRSFSRELGNTFALASKAGNSVIGGTGAVGTDLTTFTPSPPLIVGTGGSSSTGGQMPLLTNLGTVAPTSGVSYLFQSANFALDYVLDAAEAKGVGKLLSKPKVITQNNQKATVKQGTKIPVQTVVNNTVSVQFVDAVLELDVTPQITADGTIYMDVTVENDQIDQGIPRVQGIPAIDTQSAETKVTVVDGSTIVIGGIIVTTQNTAIQDVPVIGSLPLVGNLFKHTTVSSTSQELLFFITPRILPG